MKKKVLELLTLAAASPVHRHYGRQKVLIPKCDLTGRRVMVNHSSSVPVSLHSGIDTFLVTPLLSETPLFRT